MYCKRWFFSKRGLTGILTTLGSLLLLLSSSRASGLGTPVPPTPTSVTLTWTAPGDDSSSGTATQYSLRYSTSPITEPNWSAALVVSGVPAPQAAGSEESFVVTSLTPGTQYYFAIKAADEAGNWSALSNVVEQVTAQEQTPPAAVTALALSGATVSSVTLRWTAPGDDSVSGTASQYDIRYATTAITAGSWSSATPAVNLPTPKAAGNAETFTVTGLNPSTVYYFALKTADEVPNWSGLSNAPSLSTLAEQTPPAAIASLVLSGATSNSIILSWTAPGDDGSTGTAAQYDIRYATTAITAANWTSATQVANEPAPKIAGSAETFTVTGLLSSTVYYFAIKTADEVPNWSDLSNVPSAWTSAEQTAPAAIANLILSTPTQTSLTLGWTAPGDDGSTGTAAQYDIRYSTSPITTSNWASATQVLNEPAPKTAGSAETFTVTGLNASTMYYFAIKTADEVPNWSALSNVANAQTAGDQIPPAAINDLQASAGESEGEVYLSWTAPGDDGTAGTVAAYEIRYSQGLITAGNFDSANLWTTPPTPVSGGRPQSATLTGLERGKVYSVAIRSWDDYLNPSPLSNVDTGVAKYSLVLDVDDRGGALPTDFDLAQNYPNPFNPTTSIEYSVAKNTSVTISIYNIQGQLTNTLVSETQAAGNYVATWDGTDGGGNHVASGVYFYRMQAGNFSEARKMVLLK
jgi:hypothetical protein